MINLLNCLKCYPKYLGIITVIIIVNFSFKCLTCYPKYLGIITGIIIVFIKFIYNSNSTSNTNCDFFSCDFFPVTLFPVTFLL